LAAEEDACGAGEGEQACDLVVRSVGLEGSSAGAGVASGPEESAESAAVTERYGAQIHMNGRPSGAEGLGDRVSEQWSGVQIHLSRQDDPRA